MEAKQALLNLKNDYQVKLNQANAEHAALVQAEHDKAIEKAMLEQFLADVQAQLNLVP